MALTHFINRIISHAHYVWIWNKALIALHFLDYVHHPPPFFFFITKLHQQCAKLYHVQAIFEYPVILLWILRWYVWYCRLRSGSVNGSDGGCCLLSSWLALLWPHNAKRFSCQITYCPTYRLCVFLSGLAALTWATYTNAVSVLVTMLGGGVITFPNPSTIGLWLGTG